MAFLISFCYIFTKMKSAIIQTQYKIMLIMTSLIMYMQAKCMNHMW